MIAADQEKLLVSSLRDYYAGREPDEVRDDLTRKYGAVWDDEALMNEFAVQFFDGPRAHVIRISDGQTGTVGFVDSPRFYFAFMPAVRS
jgi:hypothetical protein